MAHTALYATQRRYGHHGHTRPYADTGRAPGGLATLAHMIEAVWGADTIDANAAFLTNATPVLWYYVTGTTQAPEIEWEPADVARFPHSQTYRIDQGFGNQLDMTRWFQCDEFDLEAGAWTVLNLIKVIRARNEIEWSTRVYASARPWLELLAGLAQAGVSARSLYWREANWNLSELQARGLLSAVRYAIQWASPSSNPLTIIPGTNTELRVAGADLNVARLSSTGWRG